MKELYTISIVCGAVASLHSRISLLLNRQRIHIVHFHSASIESGKYLHFKIVVSENEMRVVKMVKLLEKQIDVYNAVYYPETRVKY